MTHPADGHQEIAYRADIDGLRALAVSLVVAFHAFPLLVPGGFVGVDVFFVISGYLISSIILTGLATGRFSFAEFYARRVLRIFPALLVVLSACLVVGWFVLVPNRYQQLGEQITAGGTFLANLLFWRQAGYFDTLAEAKPLLHLWSLGIEEQFYIVWPLTLVLCHRLERAALAIILTIAAASFAFNVGVVHGAASDAFYLPQARFWELLLGAALACEHARRSRSGDGTWAGEIVDRSISMPNVKSLLGVAAIVAAVVLIDKDCAFPGWWACLPTAGAFLLIAAGPTAWFNRAVLARRASVFLGLISYPLYLWHWPVLYFLRARSSSKPPAQHLVAAIVLSVALAWLTYQLVELPLRRRKAQWRTLRLVAMRVAVAMIAVVVAGVAADLSEGVPQRKIGGIAALAQYGRYQYWADYRNDDCMLFGRQETFSPVCVESEKMAAGAPVLAIWGDSHGAHLYRGVKDSPGSARYALAQFTSSACPPVFDYDKLGVPLCRRINDSVRKEFERIKPEVVVLAHDWPQSLSARENSLLKLPATVEALRKLGARRLVLVGPVPHWRGMLPDILAEHLREHGEAEVPSRLLVELDRDMERIDRQLRDLAHELNLEYVSPLDELCNADGCLTLVPGTSDVLMAWDTMHFTREGSRYFVGLIADRLFGAAGEPLVATDRAAGGQR